MCLFVLLGFCFLLPCCKLFLKGCTVQYSGAAYVVDGALLCCAVLPARYFCFFPFFGFAVFWLVMETDKKTNRGTKISTGGVPKPRRTLHKLETRFPRTTYEYAFCIAHLTLYAAGQFSFFFFSLHSYVTKDAGVALLVSAQKSRFNLADTVLNFSLATLCFGTFFLVFFFIFSDTDRDVVFGESVMVT